MLYLIIGLYLWAALTTTAMIYILDEEVSFAKAALLGLTWPFILPMFLALTIGG